MVCCGVADLSRLNGFHVFSLLHAWRYLCVVSYGLCSLSGCIEMEIKVFIFFNLRGFNRENFTEQDDGLLNVVLAAFHVVLVHVVNAAENL